MPGPPPPKYITQKTFKKGTSGITGITKCSEEEQKHVWHYLLETPAGDYVTSIFNRYGGTLYKGKIHSNSFLGEMTSAWNTLGNYRSVENFKIKQISAIIENDTHVDSLRMREKVEKYKQLLEKNNLELKITCADMKIGTVIIDGTHRVVSFYDYNVGKNNPDIELDVYLIRPASLWVKFGEVYRIFFRIKCRLMSKRLN